MRQPAKPGAPKGRSRRAVVGAKEKAVAGSFRRLCFAAVLAVTFFLYYRFSQLDDPCRGRYIHVCKLPPRFNTDMTRDACRGDANGGGRWPAGICESIDNAGLGRPLADPADGVLTGEDGWYGTRQLALDVIFHNRMKRYECLTNHTAVAAAVFVPFYAALDFARYAGQDNVTRDAASVDLAEWLKWRLLYDRQGQRPQDGHDNFLVAGRTARDLARDGGNSGGPNWGTNLLARPVGRNLSVLVLESSLAPNASEFAVPYPTYFHPRSDADVFRWQDRVRGLQRKWLMAFVSGKPRGTEKAATATIHDHVMAQCKASDACGHLQPDPDCATGTDDGQCHSPVEAMRLLQSATFCLHPPPGGSPPSYTRRWVFDAMVAGCIPVFFHPASAHLQYRWHLPEDHAKYSVFIPEAGVRAGTASIEAVLRAIPAATVARMREEVVRLIPQVVYADPRGKLETVKNAFDVAVDGILDRVARLRH
ncbi:hypothetical protein ACQJBY_034191 [Aegilops geniculata]